MSSLAELREPGGCTTPDTAPRLLLFTRFPEAGRAKTRLIPVLGPVGASELHRRLAERTLALMRETALPVEVWGTGAPPDVFRLWLGAGPDFRHQGEGDLGERMAHALGDTPAILVGSDLPLLATGHLEAAAAIVRAGRVALGPAEDGGYYLLGLPAPAPFLFTGMAWSTGTVLAETRRRLEAHGQPYDLLETLPDLDRPEDLPRFATLLFGQDAAFV